MSELQDLRDFFDDLPSAPVFRTRPTSIPGDYRLAWRLSVLCLLLYRGRGHTLSLEHLHVLWWAIRSRRSRELLLRWFSEDRRPDDLVVRFDPSLTTTLDLALGQGLVERTSVGNLSLTSQGVGMAEEIMDSATGLDAERAFLGDLPRSITQRQVREILEWK